MHHADNMHYYEPHFELAEEIMESDVSETDNYEFTLTEPFFEIVDNNLFITSHGNHFVNEVNTLIQDASNKQNDWFNLLAKYVKI
jgi:hypothetical protein